MTMKTTNELLWSQMGASLDMLENVITSCPEEVWHNPKQNPEDWFEGWYQCWYLVFHTLFWLDYYLSDAGESFAPPAPFGLEELDPKGLMPSRAYTKTELQEYLANLRIKTKEIILGLTETRAAQIYLPRKMSYLELLLYNLRHVQHHVGQLNMLLRQAGHEPPGWVSKAKTI